MDDAEKKIRKLMVDQGLTGQIIAREYGCTAGAVTNVIKRKTVSKGLARKIETLLLGINSQAGVLFDYLKQNSKETP